MHTDIIITNILTTKTAFGVLAEGTESVFIPGKVADAANIRIGQTVRAVLVPNQTMPERTPWMAVYIGATEMSDEELIAWLRSLNDLGWSSEAADRIEALTAELASGSFYKEADIDALMARAEKAEAERDAAVEALAAASGGRDWGFTMCECGMSGPCMADPCKHPFVANITGESHE